ncbi:MAG: mechanosensitive ion channel family protein [Gemmatimonadales bacterium]|nr:MAG: mechanosensitive ion channel family protein [Gemmatimonadales bacterium]
MFKCPSSIDQSHRPTVEHHVQEPTQSPPVQTTTPEEVGDEWVSLVEVALGAQERLLLSAALIVVLWGLRWGVLRILNRHLDDPGDLYQWRKGTGYAAGVLVLVILGAIWFEALRDLGTFLGLIGAGLAIALRDVWTNLAGWAVIVLRQPFRVGDRIQVGEHSGDVVDIGLLQFYLLEVGNWVHAEQTTGRILHLPNARVLEHSVANHTAEFPFVWHEIEVTVTFESDWRRAREILQRIVEEEAGWVVAEAEAAVKEATRRLFIRYGTLTPTVYLAANESGVQLTLRFMCPARRRRIMKQALWERILAAFEEEARIELAYPTRRVMNHSVEGKPELRPVPRDNT